jgi:RNA polymerase sigma-70 factor (ECF subfamily)
LTATPDANKENGEASAQSMPRSSICALFEAEESGLLRFAFSLTGRRAVAEEIVQEVFLQLHARWDSVAEPRAWLYRSVRNGAFQHLRKTRRESLTADAERDSVADENAETPDDLIAHMETIANLRSLVDDLPEKDQRIIQLKYFEGLKYRDISQSTGLTVSNVGFRLHQIMKKLAAGLLPKGDHDQS